MDRDEIKTKLMEHEPELKARGVVHLQLIGSKARGNSTSYSDVDLVSDFDRNRQLTLLDMVRIESRLADILRMPVDLSDRSVLKEQIRAQTEQEGVLVF